MKRARRGGVVARWGAVGAAAVLAVVYALNVPFYAGSGVGARVRWRMEHGRVMVERMAGARRESFWVDGNQEGLRFAPEWRLESLGVWMVKVPLWMPLAGVVGAGVWAWWPRRGGEGRCAKCGYEVAGVRGGVCPECGAKCTSGRGVAGGAA